MPSVLRLLGLSVVPSLIEIDEIPRVVALVVIVLP